jgi:toxin CptA
MPPYDTSLPLRIELRPSRWLRLALLLLAACALLALLRSQAPWPVLALVPLLLAVAWPRASRRWSALVLRADGSAAALRHDVAELEVTVAAVELRGPLIVVVLEHGGTGSALALLPDALDAAARRVLLLWASRHAGRDAARGSAAHV